MSISGSGEYNLLDQLAEEFAERFRRGERPALKEYTDRYPDLADEIRDLFPAMVRVEQAEGARLGEEERTGNARAAHPPGGQIGDYRILREIGRGGMGVVYEAEQISLGRRVALKVLPGHVSRDPMVQERFRREARAAARLHHTNIVPVYEVGQDGDVRFYAMQFIQGLGLDAVIDELRRLLDRARSQSRNEAASGGQSPQPGGAHSRQGIDTPTLGEGVEVSAVVRSILTGRFDRGVQGPDPGGVSPSIPAGALARPTRSAGPAAGSDSALTCTEARNATTGDAAGPQPADPPVPALSPSTSPSSSSAILPGGTQLSSVESGRRGFFRSLAQIGRQVAGGLAYAHARGVVHRDIKPSNLLLDTEGVVWIADFGLAKGDDEGLTQSGDILGTLRYMAPERFRGEGDARADVYALGLTLYELLTLRPGFGSSDRLELIERIKTEEPVKPRSVDARIPRDLETIVLKAIEKDPKARYQTAEAVGEDLGRFLADEPIRARQVGAPNGTGGGPGAIQGSRSSEECSAAALVLGTLVSTYFALRANQKAAEAQANARRATQETLRANLEAEHARDEKRLSDRRLYHAEISLARQAWRDGQRDLVRHHLESLVPERPEDPDLRGFEWYYLRRICQWDFTLHGGTSVAFSPDGRRIVAGSPDGTVWLRENGTEREVHTLRGHAGAVNAVAYGPDGRTLASAGHDHTVKLWDADTGREVRTLHGHTAAVLVVAYGPDGRTLASGGGDHTVRIWDADTGQEIRTLRGHGAPVQGVAYSPDGRTLASASNDTTVRVWDAATGHEVRTLRGHAGSVWGVAYSPDGRTLASTGRSPDRTVRIWDVDTGRERHTLRGHATGVYGVAFSPDGRRVASASSDSTVRIWDVDTGQAVRVLLGQDADIWGLAYSPDGRQIAAASKYETVRVWDISADEEAITLRGTRNPSWAWRTAPTAAPSPPPRATGPCGSGTPTPAGRCTHCAGTRTQSGAWRTAPTAAPWPRRAMTARSNCGTPPPAGRCTPCAGTRPRCWMWPTARTATASPRPVSTSTVKVWDAPAGREVHTLRGHTDQVNGVTYSLDGRTIASASSDFTVKVWDASTGREVHTLRGHTGRVVAVAYSPDGRTLASAGFDHNVKLWEVATGREVRTLLGRATAVREIAFAPDGRRLASAGDDRLVTLWEPATGQELLILQGHTGYIRGVAFSPDGRTLASSAQDGTIRRWDATPMTPDVQAHRQARLVVESLFDRKLPTAEILARIRRDATLGTEVRDPRPGPGRGVRAQPGGSRGGARGRVPVCRADVAAGGPGEPAHRLLAGRAGAAGGAGTGGALPGLPGEARCGQLAGGQPARCRDGGVSPGPQAGRNRLPARPGRSGVSQHPGHCPVSPGAVPGGRGHAEPGRAAQHRSQGRPEPSEPGLPGAAQYRLGQTDRARAALSRLREAMKAPRWARDGEAQGWLNEAEAIELDLVFPADLFAPEPPHGLLAMLTMRKDRRRCRSLSRENITCSINWPRSSRNGSAAASAPRSRNIPNATRSWPRRSAISFRRWSRWSGPKATDRGRIRTRIPRRTNPPMSEIGRLPDPPRDRPGRHGGGVRGRADLAGPPRGAQGPAAAGVGRPDGPGAVPPRGPRRGQAAPHQHRAGLRGGPGRGRPLLRHAVHPGPGPGPGDQRAAPAPRPVRARSEDRLVPRAGPCRPAESTPAPPPTPRSPARRPRSAGCCGPSSPVGSTPAAAPPSRWKPLDPGRRAVPSETSRHYPVAGWNLTRPDRVRY